MKITTAEEIIISALHDGPKPAAEMLYRAYCAGISKRTIFSARQNVGVESIARGGRWFWVYSTEVDNSKRHRLSPEAEKWARENPELAETIRNAA